MENNKIEEQYHSKELDISSNILSNKKENPLNPAMDTTIKVVCRFRPMNTREINLNTVTCVNIINNQTLNILT